MKNYEDQMEKVKLLYKRQDTAQHNRNNKTCPGTIKI